MVLALSHDDGRGSKGRMAVLYVWEPDGRGAWNSAVTISAAKIEGNRWTGDMRPCGKISGKTEKRLDFCDAEETMMAVLLVMHRECLRRLYKNIEDHVLSTSRYPVRILSKLCGRIWADPGKKAWRAGSNEKETWAYCKAMGRGSLTVTRRLPYGAWLYWRSALRQPWSGCQGASAQSKIDK